MLSSEYELATSANSGSVILPFTQNTVLTLQEGINL